MDVNLIMFREDGTRRVSSLPPGTTTLGRKNDCTIRIPLATVSRHHAEIVIERSAVTLRDLGASNGTFVNNRRIRETALQPGDQILIGSVVFTVQIDGVPADEDLVAIRSKAVSGGSRPGGPSVSTSEHVLTAEDEIDPIAALEALASSADQTAIHDEDDLLEEEEKV